MIDEISILVQRDSLFYSLTHRLRATCHAVVDAITDFVANAAADADDVRRHIYPLPALGSPPWRPSFSVHAAAPLFPSPLLPCRRPILQPRTLPPGSSALALLAAHMLLMRPLLPPPPSSPPRCSCRASLSPGVVVAAVFAVIAVTAILLWLSTLRC